MPTVPRYNSQPVQQSALPGVRVSPDSAAFNNGSQKVYEAAEGALGSVDKVLQEEKKKADTIAFMEADRKASELQTKLQVDVSNMRGKDAAGAPDYASGEWDKGVEKIKDSLSNDTQRMAFMRSTSNRWEELNKATQFHVSGQMKAFDDQETASYIASSRSAAVINAADDQKVNTELARQQAAIDEWARRNGVSDSETYRQKVSQELSATHKGVIQARLDAGFPEDAKTYFEKVKPSMSAEDVLHSEKVIDHADTLVQGESTWNDLRGLKLSDGNPDLAKMRGEIMSRDDLSLEKKEKVWDYVKSRAGEDHANKTRAEDANDRQFMNAILDARKSGKPLSDALKLVPKFGSDDYDQSIKTEAVNKVYAPSSQTDPQTYIGIWERIREGKASKEEIDGAMQSNKVNAADWRTLREDYFKANSDGHNPEEKAAWERIKLLTDEKFGNNKKDKEGFLYEMHTIGRGKSPEELWKMANDKLQNDPATGVFGWGWTQSAQWKTDVQRLDAKNLAWGKVYGDLGKKEALAIGQAALYSGKQNWDLGDIDSFASSLGGYDKIQPGTPAHNAVQSLMKRNQLVTPSNVKAVIERYPDGKF